MKTAIAAASSRLLSLPHRRLRSAQRPRVVVVVDTDRIYRECNACRTAPNAAARPMAGLAEPASRTLEGQLRPRSGDPGRGECAGRQAAGRSAYESRSRRSNSVRMRANQELAKGSKTSSRFRAMSFARSMSGCGGHQPGDDPEGAPTLRSTSVQPLPWSGTDVTARGAGWSQHGATGRQLNAASGASRQQQTPQSRWTEAISGAVIGPLDIRG
jgi:hypothetical protein